MKRLLTAVGHIFPKDLRKRVKAFVYNHPRICPQLYAWARANPSHAQVVKVYWETHERERLPAMPFAGQVPDAFRTSLKFPVYDKTLLKIKGVGMRGPDGLLFLPDGTICHQNFWALEQVEAALGFSRFSSKKKVTKRGNYWPLIFFWGLGYYHWFNDVLSTLHGNLELVPEDTRFIVPAGMDGFHWRSLELLGIGKDRLEIFDGSEDWELENLWWQPPAAHPDNQTPGAMQWIGQTVAQKLSSQAQSYSKKVYIQRTLPHARVVVNEYEFLPALQDMGFGIYRTETMPFDEQVKLFAGAELIVAPHGAGLTNMIFSKPGTRVVEILAKGYERRCYWTLATELGHQYRFCLGQPKFPERKGEPDIEFDNQKILNVIA
jgi:capsular polysaccharide biosynthesis protein